MGITKRQIWCWVRIPWKKWQKITQQRYWPETFSHRKKMSKTSFFCHFFVLSHEFFLTFASDSKSASNSEFFIPYCILKKMLGHICNFYKLWRQTRTKQRQKKRKTFFYKCNHPQLGRTKVLKSLYPNVDRHWKKLLWNCFWYWKWLNNLKFRIHPFVELNDDLQSLPYVKGEGEMIGGGAGERSLQDDLSQPVPVHNTVG